MNNALYNHDCPPIMSDGRHVTDYRPSCYVHDLIREQNGVTNSYDLKMLLTHHALKFQQINRDFYDTKNSCYSCGCPNHRGQYCLPDPNGQVEYWNKYNQSIGYM